MYLRALKASDLPMLHRRRARHSGENGQDGDFIFAPIEELYLANDESAASEAEALARAVTEPAWLNSGSSPTIKKFTSSSRSSIARHCRLRCTDVF